MSEQPTTTHVLYLSTGRGEYVPSERVAFAACPDHATDGPMAHRYVEGALARCGDDSHEPLALVDVVTEWDEAAAILSDGTGRLVTVSLDLDEATERGAAQGAAAGAFRAAYGEAEPTRTAIAQGAPLDVKRHAATLQAWVEAYAEAEREAYEDDVTDY